MTHRKAPPSVLRSDYRMSTGPRLLYSLYGILLVITRPLRATIHQRIRPRTTWNGGYKFTDFSWKASWRILTMMDQLRLDPQKKRLLLMMLAEHLSE